MGLVGVFFAKVKGVSSKIFLGLRASPPYPLTFILSNLICRGQAASSLESHDYLLLCLMPSVDTSYQVNQEKVPIF